MENIIVFIFGLSIGSFLNVCIYRLPIDLSLVKPDSFCPSCKKEIKWYDNIPIVSYILLGGKCRYCKSKISYLYPLIEIITAIITLLFFSKWKYEPYWLFLSLIASYILIIVSVIDFKTMLISDFFSYSIAILGLIAANFNPIFSGGFQERILSSLSGILAGAGFIFALSYIGKLIYKKDAVGEGDMFLLGAIGSFMGVKGIVSVVIIASFIGSIYGISLIVFKKIDRLSYMPFGPFLSLACIFNLYHYFDFVKFIIEV